MSRHDRDCDTETTTVTGTGRRIRSDKKCVASVELECSLGLAQRIVITAHSYGGVVTMSLASSRNMSRMAGVFLTDSVHYALSGDEDMDKMLVRIGKNYVTSEEVILL